MQVRDLSNGNKIFVGDGVSFDDKQIVFPKNNHKGGNILFLEGNLKLNSRSLITFEGRNSVVFLGSNIHGYKVKINVCNNSAVFIGQNNFINHPAGDPMRILAMEETNVLIGNDGFMSTNIWLRCTDAHLIYSMDTYERINPSRSIFIGDHVWLGQYVTLLKGTQIGSGSIVGANAVVSGKKIPSNTVWAGNPARQLKDRIFWTGQRVATWTSVEKKQHQKFVTDKYSYARDVESLSFNEIDRQLIACQNADDRLQYLLMLSRHANKNRFATQID